MKKNLLLAAVLMAATLLGSCATQRNVPEWVDQLPPQNELWGIGYVKLQNESLARDAAISRARRSVAEQLGVLVQGMLTDYARESGTLQNTASIQSIERVTQDIVNTNLSGATPNVQKRMDDGTWWVRVSLIKSDAQKVIDDIFTTEASRYADFRASEATRMMQQRIAETQSVPVPRSHD